MIDRLFVIPDIINFQLASWLLVGILILLVVVSIKLIFCNSLLETVIINSMFSLLIGLSYLLMDASDVAMTEVALGACLSNCVFLGFLSKLSAVQKSNRPPAKLAYAEEFEGDAERRTAAYLSVCEDSSTASTYKLLAEVEFCKRSNLKPTRVISSAIICIIFIVVLTFAGIDLLEYGAIDSPLQNHLTKYYIEHTKSDIGIPSFVAALLASYRGYDTLGETAVILIAGISVLLLFSQKITKDA